jgi:hypothetical protein
MSSSAPGGASTGAAAQAADPRLKNNAYLGRIPEMTLEIAEERFKALRAEERQVSQARVRSSQSAFLAFLSLPTASPVTARCASVCTQH